ncbi:PilZ domain-containing protein [Sphingomonas xanthus]|uniref:PilZ domain-containing protein n=1 Tax=Sphingomonas xanthus TaxID=2594473 RepID=A0A516IQR2_9SPHN|nr:PilZ domain-containing protein [Sphingomonas xanthus]QDP19231.1 PilZ domain-containing protein [Sphingomonas xanthus]
MSGAEQSRRAERVALRADIDFLRSGDHKYRVSILDISPEGCWIDLPEMLAVGETIWIFLPSLESLHAKVCWVKDWTAGVEFTQPLHPAVFTTIEQRMRR